MSFEDLEADFVHALSDLHGAISSQRLELARTIQRRCASHLQSMKIEARDPGSPRESGFKVKEHAAALADAGVLLDNASSSLLTAGGRPAASVAAAASNGGNVLSASAAERARLEATTAKLSSGTDSLRESQKILAETMAVAEGSVGELQSHREALGRIKARTDEAGALADEANSITRHMTSWAGFFGFGRK